jgi:hypothetical protein
LECCLKLLKYYNQFTYYIRVERLTSKLYTMYLQFLMAEKAENPNFQSTHHTIPDRVFSEASAQEFSRIVEMRVSL